MFCIEAQLPGRQPLAQDTSAEASHKPVFGNFRFADQPETMHLWHTRLPLLIQFNPAEVALKGRNRLLQLHVFCPSFFQDGMSGSAFFQSERKS